MKRLFLLCLLFGLAACEGPGELPFAEPISASSSEVSDWSVDAVRVSVPDTLSVSTNPNARFPSDDIVWWEDPAGDRRAQVRSIVKAGVEWGSQLGGRRPVAIDVQVMRFHAVTPRTREVGSNSWHDITLAVNVRDLRTGTLLAKGLLEPDLDALHGAAAEAAVARGATQRARITQQIAGVTQKWLTSTGAKVTGKRVAVTPRRTQRSRPRRTTPVRTAAPAVVPGSATGSAAVQAQVSTNATAAPADVSVNVAVSLEGNDTGACGAGRVPNPDGTCP